MRLKGGDPMIFGRANEEIAALRDAGLRGRDRAGRDGRAAPGAAAIGASLTSRETARRVQFITAHSKDGVFPEDFDWGALADPRATTAVYMGNRTLPELSRRLIAEGADPATPAFLIERACDAGPADHQRHDRRFAGKDRARDAGGAGDGADRGGAGGVRGTAKSQTPLRREIARVHWRARADKSRTINRRGEHGPVSKTARRVSCSLKQRWSALATTVLRNRSRRYRSRGTSL